MIGKGEWFVLKVKIKNDEPRFQTTWIYLSMFMTFWSQAQVYRNFPEKWQTTRVSKRTYTSIFSQTIQIHDRISFKKMASNTITKIPFTDLLILNKINVCFLKTIQAVDLQKLKTQQWHQIQRMTQMLIKTETANQERDKNNRRESHLCWRSKRGLTSNFLTTSNSIRDTEFSTKSKGNQLLQYLTLLKIIKIWAVFFFWLPFFQFSFFCVCVFCFWSLRTSYFSQYYPFFTSFFHSTRFFSFFFSFFSWIFPLFFLSLLLFRSPSPSFFSLLLHLFFWRWWRLHCIDAYPDIKIRIWKLIIKKTERWWRNFEIL